MTLALDGSESYQRIALKDIEISMRVGIAAIERKQLSPQRVIVNVEMFAKKLAAPAAAIEDCINYHPIHEYVVTEWPDRPTRTYWKPSLRPNRPVLPGPQG